jgi:uncharacterized OB-fold protein
MEKTARPRRPLPVPNGFAHTEPFWEATKRNVLLLQYCTVAKRFQHVPRPVSIYTGRRTLEWREVSGEGSVYTYTWLHMPVAGFEDRMPLLVATIEVDVGVRMVANILNAADKKVQVGDRVQLAWEEVENGFKIPAFNLVR